MGAVTVLNLAVDAQALIGPHPTGIGAYSNRILDVIEQMDTQNRYVLPYFWSPRRRRPPTVPRPANFRYRRVPIPTPVVRALDRRGVNLAWDFFVGRLDACLFTGAVVRPLRRGRNVRVIHDVTYLSHPETLPSKEVAAEWTHSIRSTINALHSVITVSEAVRDELVDLLGISADRISVAPPGVDHAIFRPAPPEAVEAVRRTYDLERDYVLHTGMHEPRKNIPRLIQAFAALPAARSRDLVLALAGPPAWGSGAIAEAIRDVAAHVEVKPLGFVPTSDLVALYTGARAFAFPSLYEGFGMPVLEAIACGVPVITGDAPALREVAAGAAIHVAPTDTDALAAALAMVLDDDSVRATLSQQGPARARAYSWQRSAEVVHGALVAAAQA
jgi:glycosyltransferase involved in cell wall biosynthesis